MPIGAIADGVRRLFAVPPENPELIKARCAALSHQMPMLYLMLTINTWSLAVTFVDEAPAWIAIILPVLATIVCVYRIIWWVRARNAEPTATQALAVLWRANVLSVALAVAFSAWSFGLLQYADTQQQSHIAFYLAITLCGCIFCLVHLRSAAFQVALIINVCFVVAFATSGDAIFLATTVNVVLVSGTMLAMAAVYNQDFARMVEALRSAKSLSTENLRLANADSLTGLPNRRMFFAELDDALESAKRDDTCVTVGVLDLDDFKPVNDLFGHVTGDKLLREVARRLADTCGHEVIAARLGGDEFALIIRGSREDTKLAELGERVCASLRAPVVLPDAVLRVSASLGFASFPEQASNASELFERADHALYIGKRDRRGTTVLFSPEHDADLQRDLQIQKALRSADFETELNVFYQPIMDFANQRVIGFEALARWNSPTLGPISPGAFIPIAERTGLICAITQILLRKALAAAKLWQNDLRLSFNISARDIASDESVLGLVNIIAGSGIDPQRIDLEITETAMLSDFAQMQRAVDVFKSVGCGIALDDFGTGCSSLSHLHAVPLTKIKIDRSFVSGLQPGTAAWKIVKSLLSLSRDMGVGCVIEGVETRDELEALRELGGSVVQGYYVSRPMPEDAIAPFLREQEAMLLHAS